MTNENQDNASEETAVTMTPQNMQEIPTDVEVASEPTTAPYRGASKYKFNHAEYERWSKSLRRKTAPNENEA
jgi:hypothetical protein